MYCVEEFSEDEKLKMNPLRKKKEENAAAAGDSNDGESANKYERHSTNELCFVYRSRLNRNHSLVYGGLVKRNFTELSL